jgi:hypothetical protein
MREKVAPSYWTATGALAGFGLIGQMTIGAPFLLAGVVLALVGLPLLWTRGTWAFFVGFGGLPALVFLLHIFNGVRTALNPYCAEMGGPGALAAGAAGPGLVLVCSGQLLCHVHRVCGGRAHRGGRGSPAAAHRPPRRFNLEGSLLAPRRRIHRSSCGGPSGTFSRRS